MRRQACTSSNPVTATSAGIRTPARCSSRSTPIAIWSFAHTTACGSDLRPSMVRAAATPLPSAKSPWMTWAMPLCGLAATACSNARRRATASGASSGPATKHSRWYWCASIRCRVTAVMPSALSPTKTSVADWSRRPAMTTTGSWAASARSSPGSRTSSAMIRPSTWPASDRTRFSNGSPRPPKVSSSEYSVPRSTASAACTRWSTNSRLLCSMSIGSVPRSRPTSPMMSFRRRVRPRADASGTKPRVSMTASTRCRVSGCTRSEPRTTRDTVAIDTPATWATS